MAPSCRHRHRDASLRSAFAPTLVALLLLTPLPLLPARAQSAAQAAPSATSATADKPTSPAPLPANVPSGGSADQAAVSQPRSLTAKAIDKVKQVAKSASDIFNRVPCLPPKGGAKSMG